LLPSVELTYCRKILLSGLTDSTRSLAGKKEKTYCNEGVSSSTRPENAMRFFVMFFPVRTGARRFRGHLLVRQLKPI
jgi:hypothetical protein